MDGFSEAAADNEPLMDFVISSAGTIGGPFKNGQKISMQAQTDTPHYHGGSEEYLFYVPCVVFLFEELF